MTVGSALRDGTREPDLSLGRVLREVAVTRPLWSLALSICVALRPLCTWFTLIEWQRGVPMPHTRQMARTPSWCSSFDVWKRLDSKETQ
jgi:hypothetical protein